MLGRSFCDRHSAAVCTSSTLSEYRCSVHGCDRWRQQYGKLNLALRRTGKNIDNLFLLFLPSDFINNQCDITGVLSHTGLKVKLIFNQITVLLSLSGFRYDGECGSILQV